MAFTEHRPNNLLFIEGKPSRVIVATSFGWAWSWVHGFLENGHSVFVVDREFDNYSLPSNKQLATRVPLMTCSNLIAYHIGLTGPCYTPWQLSRRVLEHGGKQLTLSEFERRKT